MALPIIFDSDTEHQGKVFDNPGYESALKKSGWTADEANKYWNDVSNRDEYSRAGKQIDEIASAQAPKVKITDNGITISAPQAVLDSPIVQQIDEQLQALKGADLRSAEAANAVDVLNKEIEKSIHNWMVEDVFGWTPEEFDDYQRTIQIVNVTNPMNSKEKIKAKRPGGDLYTNEDGTVMEKTPQQWIDYWREIFTTDQRREMFKKSFESDDPYERVMALIMSKGNVNPIYGFNQGEKIAQGFSAFRENTHLFPKGVVRTLGTSNDVKRVEELVKSTGVDLNAALQSSDYMSWNADNDIILTDWTKDEGSFNKMKENVSGKSWKELSDLERLFVLEVGVSKENSSRRPIDRGMLGDERQYSDDLKNANSEDDGVSREAIANILQNNSYEKLRDINSDFLRWQAWDAENITGPMQRLAENSSWAANEIKLGTMAGTVGRFLWEDMVARAVTGHSMNRISDAIGDKLLGWLEKKKISPVSATGQGLLRFTANLIGTIPEDIVQTAVDNILTYNAGENANLFNLEEMSDNFKNNLIFMTLFNGARAGWSGVKKARIIKRLAKQLDMDVPVDIGLSGGDASDIAKAYEEGGRVETDGQKAYKVNADGTREELENTTPEQAEIVAKAMEVETPTGRRVTGGGDEADATLKAPEFDDAARAANDAASVVDDAGRAVDEATESTVKVEVDTPDGKKTVETPEVTFKSYEDAWDPNFKIEPTKAGIRLFKSRALRDIMNAAQTNLFGEFRARFGDITTDDFDWIFKNVNEGKSIADIIGTRNPKNGKIVDQNMIDAVKWFGNHPMVKNPRLASRAGLELEGDYNKLGYLPHTSYDPDILPFEEIKPGQLWKRFTGKSVTNDSGEFIGYGGTLESRYRTYISNMLNDIHAKDIAAAQLIEDAALDGKQLAPDEALKMTEGWQKIEDGVTNPKKSKSMNGLEKGALADGDGGKSDFEEADAAFKKEAPNSGVSRSMNKNFAEMFIGSGTKNVEQPQRLGKATFAVGTQGDTMRNIKVNGVSMYDAGAADMTYAAQNAFEFVTRWMNEGADPAKFRSNLIEYLKVHSKRTAKYAEPVADRIIARIAKENQGSMTKGGVIKTLTKSFRSEGFNRLRRWTVLADYSQFDEGTIKFMDSFWYKHMQMEALTNNKAIIDKITDGIKNIPNKLTEARYNALFYGNFKNALLQISELNRLFTVFKLGDVVTMLRKMATDADFRAKVDMYVEAVAPRTGYVDAGLYENYGNASDGIDVGETETKFNSIKDAKKTINNIALAPINAAESLKNRTMVAALVAEADRLEADGKITGGNEKLMRIRQRFERVALAQNEMGKIGLATNPFAKPFLFLQNFTIRELGMNWYNIVDPDDLLEGTKLKKGRALNAVKYLTKLFGAKLGTALILTRLGYSAAQVLGVDPLGVSGNYNRLSDDEKTAFDEQLTNGVLTPFFAGGLTSLFADMYFMAREAYEKANRESIEDEAGANFDKSQNPLDRMDWGAIFNLENLGNTVAGFIPGSVFANRIGQMNEMMDTGWALSGNGNKMYTAPDDAFNTALGYLFGRSATQNAQDYRQTYGDDLGQTLGRIWRGVTGQGTTFDPIDTQNYTDWFDGSENDLQQFEKGKRWFIDERDRILDTYQTALQRKDKYGDIYESEAKASMIKRLDDLFEKLERFVDAYEKENGTISGKMVKELIGVLNIEKESPNYSQSAADESGQNEYSKAKERYAQLGLPAVGYYSGPSEDYPGTSVDESKIEVKYKGSPQWQVSSTSRYNLSSELAAVLAAGDAVLQDYRSELKDLYGQAVESGNYTEFNKAQNEYLKAFDNVVGPIVATYGVGTLNDDEVKAQLEKMLSTSPNSGKNIGNLVPYKQYATDKRGRVRSVPNESINVVKWAIERYGDDIFKRPTIRSYSTAQEDLDAIKRLIDNGQTDMARARALSLKVRIDNQKRSLNKTDYQWLLDFLNNGGQ